MNVKPHDVITCLTGDSGLVVVRGIRNGERDPQKLLQCALRDPQEQG